MRQTGRYWMHFCKQLKILINILFNIPSIYHQYFRKAKRKETGKPLKEMPVSSILSDCHVSFNRHNTPKLAAHKVREIVNRFYNFVSVDILQPVHFVGTDHLIEVFVLYFTKFKDCKRHFRMLHVLFCYSLCVFHSIPPL